MINFGARSGGLPIVKNVPELQRTDPMPTDSKLKIQHSKLVLSASTDSH
jgi:hypothetical protein